MLGWEFPPYFAGGVGVVCYELTRALAKRHDEVTYLMPSGPREVHADFVNLLVADNLIADGRVSIARVGSLLTAYGGEEQYRAHYDRFLSQIDGKSARLYGHNLLAEIERFAQKVAFLAQEMHMDFDVIHAHDWTTFPAALALKRLTGKPLVVHVHITEFDKTGGQHADPRVYAIEKAGMDGADIVIAVSNLVKNRCVHQYFVDEAKVRVVYNAAENVASSSGDHQYPINVNDKVVLFLGRVTLQKGPDYFVEAAKRVIDYDPNVKFIMAGSGDMLPRMIERSAELGIGSKMIFPGFVSREQGDTLYRMADVFVMPSVSEPFGIVPLEAMQRGTPVIISRQSGVSEVLQHALKVDFWDVDDIANKIIAALSYTTLHHELRQHGSIEVQRFNWDTAAEQVDHIYEELRRRT
jgi:glycogen synthase